MGSAQPQRGSGLHGGASGAAPGGVTGSVPARLPLGDPRGPAAVQAERIARDAFGRIVASLAWRWRDLAAAQDALADALLAALGAWPRDGVPACPEAWLTSAAKRRLLQKARHRQVADNPALRVLFEVEEAAESAEGLPDRRLSLLFVCAHPHIDPGMRTPLMLQAVPGIDAARIASAFLLSLAAMAQRLVWTKQAIRASGNRFEVPAGDQLAPRLGAVLEAVYAAYSTDWDAGARVSGNGGVLAEEAIFLARVVAGCMPGEPEAIGLLARAAALRRPGPFQLKAAIQSVHCQRLHAGRAPWNGIVELYRVLDRIGPTVATATGFAVALVETGDLARARQVLDVLPARREPGYQSYWIARWHLHRRAGEAQAAAASLATGIGLTSDPRIRAWLLEQVDARPGG